MKLIGGLNTDVKEIDLPEGSWVYAKNIVISDKFGSVINEEGFKEFSPSYTAKNLTPIGIIEALDKAVIFSAENEIGILKRTGEYTTIINNINLGFDVAYPIKGTFKYNRNNELIVAFIADNISPMLLNLDNLPSDLNKAKIFADAKVPIVSLGAVLQSGGNLQSGVYYFSLAYRNNEYNQTNWMGTSNPVSIIDDNVFNSFNTVDGCEADSPTSKAISLNISNLDTKYDKLVISVISKINGTVRAYKLPEVEISGNDLTYLYTGGETITDLDITEIIVERPFYTGAKAIAQVSDKLLLGNVKSSDNINYQSYANQITASYVTQSISATGVINGYKNPSVIFDKRGFMDGEVYAFYIVLRFVDGSRSRAFHIPGRAPAAGETSAASLGNNVSAGTNFALTVKKFHVEDTADAPGVNAKLGYWENLTERYPNDSDTWGSLAGQPVRHHKMPTIEKLGYSPTDVKAIGVKFDNIVIPAELQSIVQGYEIFYAKKTLVNTQVLGQDIALFAASAPFGYPSTYWTTGGNWNIAPDKRTGQSWSSYVLQVQNTHLRLHNFDLLRLTPQFSPTHILVHKKITKNGTNLPFEIHGKLGSVIERSSSGDLQNTSLIFDYTASNTDYADPGADNKLRELITSSYRYIPNHTNDGEYNNWYGENCVSVKLEKPGFLGLSGNDNPANKAVATEYGSDGADPVLRIPGVGETSEVTFLISICQLKRDVYNSFMSQELVSTGVINSKALSSATCFGGDTFVNNYSFITTAPRHSFENPEEIDTHKLGVKVIRNVVVKSYSNIEYRYQDARENSKYYPKVPSTQIKKWLQEYDRTDSSYILYNNDYNSVNDLGGVLPETFEKRPNNYPHRIIQSVDLGRESELDSWNRFLPNDYYEVIKNKGEILNLVSLNNNLFIHLERDLLRTVGQENLQLQGAEVYIGSGNLFDRDPVPMIPADRGYAGTVSRFANLLCKIGYIFVDNLNGKVFISGGETQEISNKGVKQFLRENLQLQINKQLSDFLKKKVYVDNPFVSAGTTLVYEEDYNRLIITKKDFVIIDMNRFKGEYDKDAIYGATDIYLKGNTLLKGNGVPLDDSDVYHKSFSISYSFDLNVWVCFHDYIMDRGTYIMEKNLLLKNNKIYEANQKDKRAIYFTDEVHKSIIIPVFNFEPDVNKLFTNFSWLTDVVNSVDGKEVNKTITKVTVFNGRQCSGEINIVPFESIVGFHNARKVHDGWNFNQFRDIVVDTRFPFIDKNYNVIYDNLDNNKFWFDKGRFTGKWIGLKIEFSNEKNLDNSQNILYLYNVSAEVIKATR